MIKLIKKYEVNGVVFDDVKDAERINKILNEIPNSIICNDCKGLGFYNVTSPIYTRDEWGMPVGFSTKTEKKQCTCKDGIRRLVVEEKYV
jgi:hypothetical protein